MTRQATAVIVGAIAICALIAGAGRRWTHSAIARGRMSGRRCRRGRRGRFVGAVAALARRRVAHHNPTRPGDVAALLDQTARRCASGVSLGEAFIAALEGSALAEAFAHARAALLAGATIDSALDHVPVDQPDVALATHVLRLCATQGGPVSESLDRAAATLREREAVAQERVAQSAQARLSARVLTLLPIAFGGWTVLTTPTVRRFFVTPIGLICLLLGVGLNAGGWLLMRRLSRGVA